MFILALAMALKGDSHSELKQLLNNIPSITVALVNLEYKEEVLPSAYQAVCISNICIIILLFT